MKYNSNLHHRHTIRLKGYDYSRAGMYFITICTQNREKLFGEIIEEQNNTEAEDIYQERAKNKKMILNFAGEMVEKIWISMKKEFRNIDISEYIIMPNHFHAIIKINDVGAESISARNKNGLGADIESAPTIKSNIQKIIQSFKRYTTVEYIKMVKQNILTK